MPRPPVVRPRSFPSLGHGGGSWSWNAERRKIELKFMADGKRRLVRGDTTTECLAKRDEVRAQTAHDVAVAIRLANGEGTVGEMMAGWFAYHAGGRAPSTQATYQRSIELLAETSLLERPARQVTRGDIQNVLLYFVNERDLGYSYLHKLRTHLHMAFIYGEDHGFVSTNPAHRIKLPGHVKRPNDPVWLDNAGFEAMRRHLTQRHSTSNAALLTALLTGLRPGEVLAICWDALDLEAATLSVERNIQRSSRGRVFTLTTEMKTRASKRLVQLPRDLVVALRHERNEQNRRRLAARTWCQSDLVFTRDDGRMMSFTTLHRNCHRVCRAIGVPLLSPNKLRHTHASVLLDRNVPIPDVAKQLGHIDMQMVMSTYGHSMRPHVLTATLLADEG